jgi:hypothetical protein
LPPSSPAGSACLSSKGIVNSICRARESDSQQQSDWTNGPASSQFSLISSGNLFFLLLLSDCVVYQSFLLVSTQFHPSAHTHTRRQTDTLSFVLLCWPFFSFVSFVTLILQHLNRIRLDGGSQTGRKSPGGRLIRRHCLFWRVDGL